MDYEEGKYAKPRGNGEIPSMPDELIQEKCGSYSFAKWNSGLIVELKRGRRMRQFQYANLLSDGPDDGFAEDGTSFSVVFAGLTCYRVTVKGRNLKKYFDGICFHRQSMIRAIDEGRDFESTNDPVITSIEIEPIEKPA